MKLWCKRMRILGLLTVGALSGVGALPAQEAPVKIAVVDLDRVVAQSAPGLALQEQVQRFQNETRAAIEAKTVAGMAIRQRIAEGASSLSETRLEELQKEFEEIQISVRRLQDDKQREGQKLQNDGLKRIEKQIAPVLAEIRDEKGIDLILNWVPGVVVMVRPRLDITQELIDRLAAGNS